MKEKITQITIVLVFTVVGFTPLAYAGATNFDRLVLDGGSYGAYPNATADITMHNGETIDNDTDGQFDFGAANLLTTGTLSVGAATLTGLTGEVVSKANFSDEDWGDVSVLSNSVTIDEDVIDKANFADEDWGDVSVSSNLITLDADVVDTAEMADGDHGDYSWLSGVGTIDDDVIDAANLANGDFGDFSVSSNLATLDPDVVGSAEMDDEDHGDYSWSSGVGTIDDDVLDAANLADGDFGDFSVTTNLATLDNDVVGSAEMDDEDHGDIAWSSGVATVEGAAGAFVCLGRFTTTDGVAGGTERFVGGTAFDQIIASNAVSATDTEVFFDQTYAIPANTLRSSVSVNILTQGIITADNSSDTLTIKVYFGGTTLLTTDAVDVSANDIWYANINVIIRTSGSSGTMVSTGAYQDPGTSGTANLEACYVASTAINTTIENTIRVSAEWSTTNAGNSCRQDIFKVRVE